MVMRHAQKEISDTILMASAHAYNDDGAVLCKNIFPYSSEEKGNNVVRVHILK